MNRVIQYCGLQHTLMFWWSLKFDDLEDDMVNSSKLNKVSTFDLLLVSN